MEASSARRAYTKVTRAACGLPSRICSQGAVKSLRGLFGAERIPDHRAASRHRRAGRGHGLRRLAVPDGMVDEISTIPDQFTLLMQIGNLPDEALATVAEPRPVPARRRNEARTCDGGCRHRSGPGPALSPCGLRCAVRPGRCPAAGVNAGPPLFSGWENLSWAEGILSVRFIQRLTVMHVHPA
jgi:hypothetical protein